MKVSPVDWAQFLHLASQSGRPPPAPRQWRHCVSLTYVQAWDVSCVVFADLQKVFFHVWSIHVGHTSGDAGRGGASALTKVWICPKSGKKHWKYIQNSRKSSQKFRPGLFDFKNGKQRLQNITRRSFWEVTPNKLFIIFVGKIFRHKSAKNLIGEICENLKKNV